MSNAKIPHKLPESKIIDTLVSKANELKTNEFNFIYNLDQLRETVSLQVSRINQLFPEYTPHDEEYHLKRLFNIADKLLGDDLIEKMNIIELFLLSISLYAHDWGMAVSEEEKETILNNSYTELLAKDFLGNESHRFELFCKERSTTPNNISNHDWSEYVRITHAFRSGIRVFRFFEEMDSNLGEFASRISEGHWLDFDILEDYDSYPNDASIMGYTVNVKALTIYVRLIDLLDLGSDRTPFILWKFISPKNVYSKIEWQKHKALSPVTFPTYNIGRIIQIDGVTDNLDVYLGIMDLKKYVDEQFRLCNDLLNRSTNAYYKLNISHIDWRVKAKGFEPILIQFEFDRTRMFDILSDEIYQSNPYVFIRELLQNSIDAIKMRLEIYKRGDMSFMPKITVKVDEDDVHYFVSITDNGIGMDEYIVKNYLTVAGKSYYKSDDFKKEGLNIDPISKFGIGVLSCFMSAEFLEIETYRDPLTKSQVSPLKISVPAKQRYLKIEKTNNNNIGSTFKVHVIKELLPKNEKSNTPIELNVLDFVKKTSGFVPFPITIQEKNNLTTIIPPSKIQLNDSDSVSIDYSFKYDSAFPPQYHDAVKKYFNEHRIYLKNDLGLDDYDGCLTFLIPKKTDYDIVGSSMSWPIDEARIINYSKGEIYKEKIKWNRNWINHRSYQIIPWNKFEENSYEIYLDGIWVKDISAPEPIILNCETNEEEHLGYMYDSFVVSQWRVNIPKPNGLKIDLARTKLNTKQRWDKPIWDAFFKYVKMNIVDDYLCEADDRLLLSLGRLTTFYHISPQIIINNLIQKESFPIPFYDKESKIIFKRFDSSNTFFKRIKRLCTDYDRSTVEDLLSQHYIRKRIKKNHFIQKFISDDLLLFISDRGNRHHDADSCSIKHSNELVNHFISQTYYLSKIEFVTSPKGSQYPFPLEILELKDSTLEKQMDIAEFMEQIDFSKLGNKDLLYINVLINRNYDSIPTVLFFDKPYSNCFAFGSYYLNITNPTVQLIVEILLKLVLHKKNDTLEKKSLGVMFDLVGDISLFQFIYSENVNLTLKEINEEINSLISKAKYYGIITQSVNPIVNLSKDDFVLNSVEIINEKIKLINYFEKIHSGETKEWGLKIE